MPANAGIHGRIGSRPSPGRHQFAQRHPLSRRFTLEELVAGMTPETEHPLEDDGPVGEELI
jgi:hypothetical protein